MRTLALNGLLIWAALSVAAQTGAKDGEWRIYGGDLGSTRYSPLEQIDASSFSKLMKAPYGRTTAIELKWRSARRNAGKEVGAVYMPAPQSGSPTIYMPDRQQYIVLAISGGAYSGERIAFKLPN